MFFMLMLSVDSALIKGNQTTQLMGVHMFCAKILGISYSIEVSHALMIVNRRDFSVTFFVLDLKRFKRIVTLTNHYWITGMYWIWNILQIDKWNHMNPKF